MGRIALGRKTNPGYKPYWQWTVSRDGDALELTRDVYPQMGERRSAKIEEIFIWWRMTELIPRDNRRRSPRRIEATTEPGLDQEQH